MAVVRACFLESQDKVGEQEHTSTWGHFASIMVRKVASALRSGKMEMEVSGIGLRDILKSVTTGRPFCPHCPLAEDTAYLTSP